MLNRKLHWVLAAVILVTCSSPGAYEKTPRTPGPTLNVVNRLPVPVGIYTRGVKIGTADGMRTTCLELYAYPNTFVPIVIRPLAEEGYATFGELDTAIDGWMLEVDYNRTTTALSLRPAPRCTRRPDA